MPNHIQSQVEIKGPADKIKKLIEDTKINLNGDAAENQFDFNAIVPMPPELDITSGSNTDLAFVAWGGKPNGAFNSFESYLAMPWWESRYPGIDTREKLLAYLKENDIKSYNEGKQALDNYNKYGYSNWYDWRNFYWGTKWNAYDVKYIAHDDTHLVLEITTAWDTPREIWRALEEQGFQVNGLYYGEMEGYDRIGDGGPFYASTEVEWDQDFTPLETEQE